ncbi:MAG: DUF4382 domain-containing protein [Leptolyngbyaceae bacterium]|nr:DUF4382 domain-containing protein [Leptolyngbyaceae bacterium]
MNSHCFRFRPFSSLLGRGSLGFMLCAFWVGCSQSEQITPSPEENETSATPGTGSLTLTANGEDFVRQGFETKDGWAIAFDHVFVTVTEATAYQTDPPYDAKASNALDPSTVTVTQLLVDTPQVVDLAQGDSDADPIAVTTESAPSGRYNALVWAIAPDKAAGREYSIQLVGTATKGDRTIAFDIGFDPSFSYTCGDFVGDSRKGFLDPDAAADLEMTLHFDHIFGDGEAPADDDINTGALGFDPLAAVAEGDTLTTDLATLQAKLSSEDQALLTGAIAGLGHVGEGHCALTQPENNP